jgi:hypothetical protein
MGNAPRGASLALARMFGPGGSQAGGLSPRPVVAAAPDPTKAPPPPPDLADAAFRKAQDAKREQLALLGRQQMAFFSSGVRGAGAPPPTPTKPLLGT